MEKPVKKRWLYGLVLRGNDVWYEPLVEWILAGQSQSTHNRGKLFHCHSAHYEIHIKFSWSKFKLLWLESGTVALSGTKAFTHFPRHIKILVNDMKCFKLSLKKFYVIIFFIQLKNTMNILMTKTCKLAVSLILFILLLYAVF